MKLVLEGTGQHQELTIPWGPDVRGPYGPEQSMARKPMKEHEERSLRMFMPTPLNKICDIKLQAREIEPAIMGDGTKRPLLRVEQTTKIDGKVHRRNLTSRSGSTRTGNSSRAARPPRRLSCSALPRNPRSRRADRSSST